MSVTTYDGHENSVPLPPIPVGLPSSDVLYVLPANAQANWKPIYDDPSKQVIGFYTISSNIKHIYDIEGKFVTISEPGLESSYIIDDIIFLLVGIGEIRYILRGGRELIAVAGRRAGRAAVYGITAGIISESAITGLRVAFRQLATRQVFRFTTTTAARMAAPGRFVPIHILYMAIKFGTKVPDPQGVDGAVMFVSKVFRLSKTGQVKEYTLNVVVRLRDWTILHFHME